MRRILARVFTVTSVLLAIAAPAFAQPVLHLKFDNPSDLGADSSGNNHHGSALGVVAKNHGVAGGAAIFTGESLINIGGVSQALANDFTISMWVKTTLDTDQEIDLFGDGNGGPKVRLNAGRAGFGLGNEASELESQSDISVGQFVHVLVTRNATTGEESIWVNGTLEATRHGSSNAINVQNILALGGNPGEGRAFAGAIDDFQVYNRAFNASAVAFLHANPGSAVGQFAALSIPEPSTYALMGLGVVVVAWRLRRRRN